MFFTNQKIGTMKRINKSGKNKNRFFTLFLKREVYLLLAFLSLFALSCKKEIKAGDPIALTYNQVYMVGSATPVAWDINKAIAMTPTSGSTDEFSWEGPLVAGEIKFPTAKSWSSDTFMAATAGQSITNNKAMLTLNGSPDQKWLLTNSDAGKYKITLNTKDQTVTFKKE
jgi:hypothetical protein